MTKRTSEEERDLERDLSENDETLDDETFNDPGMDDLDDGISGEDENITRILQDEDSKKRSKGLKIAITALIVVLLLILAGLGAWWYAGSRHHLPQSAAHYRSSLGDSGSDSSASTTSSGLNPAARSRYLKSIGVPDYYAMVKDRQSKKQAADAAAAAVAGMPDNAQTALSSSASNPNLTDDMSKAFNSDGSMNPNYSFLTADNVSAQVRDDMEFLANPIYGSWTDLQSPRAKEVKNPGMKFAPMFSADKSAAVQSADLHTLQSMVPVFADWNSDSYGGRYYNRVYGPIVGTVGPSSCEYHISGTMDDSITCSAPIIYHIMMKQNEVKTENHTLTITYRPQYSGKDKDVSRRIMIDSIQQQ